MKKIFISFFIACLFGSFNFIAAYSSGDFSNASYLASQGLIVQQENPFLYRLDDLILRQEVVALALKMRGIDFPEKYICKGYFLDIPQDGWVCRTMEIAADNGIISRENNYARPRAAATRSEALALLLKTGKVSLSEPRRVTQPDGTIWSLFEDLKILGFTQWQADMLDSLPNCLFINHGVSCEDGASTNYVFSRFMPNEFLSRSDAFEYAVLLLGSKNERGLYDL